MERTPQGLAARYRIEGDLSRVRVPSPAQARRADNLWRHTCCELFLARGAGYREYNFSPSGEWAAYAFDDYRKAAGNVAVEPRIRVRSGSGFLELEADVPESAEAQVGLSAVIEDSEGTLSYWALRHTPGKPDFHHPDAFALRLA